MGRIVFRKVLNGIKTYIILIYQHSFEMRSTPCKNILTLLEPLFVTEFSKDWFLVHMTSYYFYSRYLYSHNFSLHWSILFYPEKDKLLCDQFISNTLFFSFSSPVSLMEIEFWIPVSRHSSLFYKNISGKNYVRLVMY